MNRTMQNGAMGVAPSQNSHNQTQSLDCRSSFQSNATVSYASYAATRDHFARHGRTLTRTHRVGAPVIYTITRETRFRDARAADYEFDCQQRTYTHWHDVLGVLASLTTGGKT